MLTIGYDQVEHGCVELIVCIFVPFYSGRAAQLLWRIVAAVGSINK
jgi:hypothetical protein